MHDYQKEWLDVAQDKTWSNKGAVPTSVLTNVGKIDWVTYLGDNRSVTVNNATTNSTMRVGDGNARLLPEIEKVIFNPPATIVVWKDGTKTVAKCSGGDGYSEDHGLAMCVARKYFKTRSQMKKTMEGGKRPQERE